MRWVFFVSLILGWSTPALSNDTEAAMARCACACVSSSGVEGDANGTTIHTVDLFEVERGEGGRQCSDFNGQRCAMEDVVLGFFGSGRAEQCGELRVPLVTPISR